MRKSIRSRQWAATKILFAAGIFISVTARLLSICVTLRCLKCYTQDRTTRTSDPMKKLLHSIEVLHNRASDTSFVWFPFLFLKPKQNETIDLKRRIAMAVCFGCYFSVYNFVLSLFWGPVLSGSQVLMAAAKFCLLFFLWFTFVTAFFWNRRARKLQ